jgi:transposase
MLSGLPSFFSTVFLKELYPTPASKGTSGIDSLPEEPGEGGASEVNGLQKVLEEANIKLASVATDIRGVSARAMLWAIVRGPAEAEALAELARGQLREKRGSLEKALYGPVKGYHRFLLAEQLAHLEYLKEALGRVSVEIEERLGPFEEELALLESIPGVGRRTAEVLLAEVGVELERFPTARHLASWAMPWEQRKWRQTL